MTTYPLLIAIEHALPNWPLVEEGIIGGSYNSKYKNSTNTIRRS
jgi:hypothetical protein